MTLIDAFRIADLNLLIFSYLFREAHNYFILHSENYVGTENISHENYCWGSFVGVLLTGLFLDLIMKNRRFLAIWILNTVLFCFDIYIICVAATNKDGNITPTPVIEGLMGAVLGSNDLIYLIMIPMYMAKNHSE